MANHVFSTKNAIRFKYTNWEGKTTIRTAKPIKLWYGTTEFHRGKHWSLKGFVLNKKAERDYALGDIIKIYLVKQPKKREKAK